MSADHPTDAQIAALNARLDASIQELGETAMRVIAERDSLKAQVRALRDECGRLKAALTVSRMFLAEFKSGVD